MSELVNSDRIEEKVGAFRHAHLHRGRVMSAEQTLYILHSQKCLNSGIDLRDCLFSHALDRGVDLTVWEDWEDQPVNLHVTEDGSLLPSGTLDGKDV